MRKYLYSNLYRIKNIEDLEAIVAGFKEVREKALEDAAKIAQANARGKSCPILSMHTT